MPHHPLIATIVGALVLAFLFGALANRLRISPLVGYLLAGVAAGPFTPGFVADRALASELAEIGVILLMFGVGLHFSLKDLLAVKAISIPGAIVQIGIATVLGMGLAWTMGWTPGAGLVFGLALSVASTVVLLRALEERRLIDTQRGRIAVGWLIVEDLAMVLALVLLPAVAGLLGGAGDKGASTPAPTLQEIGIIFAVTLGKVAAFLVVMLVVGRRVIPWILHYTAHTGSRELFRLAVLAIALGVAFGSTLLFDVSFALGAFFAGMILSESELSHQAAEDILPLRDAFAVLFFVSVGMLFDPTILLRDPLPVLATFLIIVVGKSVAAFGIVRAFRHPPGTALMVSASLAQIGEFSFILASLGVSLGLLPKQGQDLILAGAILSIFVNPLLFIAVEPLTLRLQRRSDGFIAEAGVPPEAADPVIPRLTGHAVLVGFGRVGGLVGEALGTDGIPFVVIEERPDAMEILRSRGIPAIRGNATADGILDLASIAAAERLFVAIPNAFEAGDIVLRARAANAGLEIIARAHFDAEVEHLREQGADFIVMGEREIARGMVEHIRGKRQNTETAA